MIEIIENTAELQKFCDKLSTHPFITVDLEFMREHTYYAKLCLIQVGSHSRCAIIDPLAEGIELQPFFDLMTNPNVIKVFHSGRQDIEIIYNLSHRIPTPFFDTQIAGMVTGFGEAVSYENLVSHVLHIKIDKSNRLSDWSKRPLSQSQLEYALADVTHLVHIYEHLSNRLREMDRENWITDEINQLCKPEIYETDPQEAWQKIKHRSHSARFLTFLKELAAWRESRAQKRNTPRHSFVKDDALLTICAICPKDKDELLQIRTLRKDIASGKIGDEIIEVLNHCRSIPEADYVTPPKFKDFQEKGSSLHEVLKLLLKIVSQQENIVPRLIASDEELRDFSNFEEKSKNGIKDWRFEIFWRKANALRMGKLSLHYNPETHNFVFEERKN